MMANRAYSLDAFRGYAIITMILSGTVASGVLPGWMYHAQVGPKSNFAFDPSIYGITWVDLVFPFFLFAMGAAFPFSLGSKIEKGVAKWKLVLDSFLRGFRLTFFAVFIQHLYPWSVSQPQDAFSWGIAVGAFFLMFPMFMRIPRPIPIWMQRVIEISAYVIGVIVLLVVPYANNRVFNLGYSNIIILVLANMSIFGSLLYLFTPRNKWCRIAILPFVMAVFLGSTTENSWVEGLMNFTPCPWLYKFLYLKYLFIVIPGSIAGEYLREWLKLRTETEENTISDKRIPIICVLSITVILCNLYGLYMRYLVFNLVVTIIILLTLYYFLRGNDENRSYWRKLFIAGAYLLMLGLFFEAYQGGIRKDDSTYSYYFVTSGLAFIAMIAFSILCDVCRIKAVVKPLEMVGQNPMIAYVAPQLLIMPLLNLTGLAFYLNLLNQNAWMGFLRGVVVTALAVCVAILCTKRKLLWRT